MRRTEGKWNSAIRQAKLRNAAISESVFDFIQNVLLLEHPAGVDDAQRAERKLFAMRFQQLSAPVMAKGVEDTASLSLLSALAHRAERSGWRSGALWGIGECVSSTQPDPAGIVAQQHERQFHA